MWKWLKVQWLLSIPTVWRLYYPVSGRYVIIIVTNWNNQFVRCIFEWQHCILLNHGSHKPSLQEFGLKEHICLIACYKSREKYPNETPVGWREFVFIRLACHLSLLKCGSSATRSAPRHSLTVREEIFTNKELGGDWFLAFSQLHRL